MKEYGLSPDQWRALTRVQRKTLFYHRIMENHYMATQHEKAQLEMEREQRKQKIAQQLPRQVFPRRRLR